MDARPNLPGLTDARWAVYVAFRELGAGATVAAVAKHLHKSEPTVHEQVGTLCDLGLMRRETNHGHHAMYVPAVDLTDAA